MADHDNTTDIAFTLACDKNFVGTTKRCPVVLIVDTSYSMKDRINELNEGVEELKKALMEDEVAHDSVDIAIVDMGNKYAYVAQPFVPVPSWEPETYDADGITPMAGAIELALEQIQYAKSTYSYEGVSHYRPWLIIFSDGCPTDEEGYFDDQWEDFVAKVNKESEGNHLICFTFYIGDDNVSNEDKFAKRAKEVLYSLASSASVDKSNSTAQSKFAYQLSDGPEQLKNIFLWLSNSVRAIVNEDKSIDSPPANTLPTSMFD